MEIKSKARGKMKKTYRLFNLLLILIPLALLAFIAGLLGLIFFEIRYWKYYSFNQ